MVEDQSENARLHSDRSQVEKEVGMEWLEQRLEQETQRDDALAMRGERVQVKEVTHVDLTEDEEQHDRVVVNVTKRGHCKKSTEKYLRYLPNKICTHFMLW